ncbi:CHC2 zinc finger domain-containing protein [Treponema endosymbiont of Eucomonympha sp.]|uniref:CHC2 zinc finger domain-containing protein n=1 Tax=Treponema endosymbiont of Eucomonympha sp. TaxID=1580831 RepID=UPI001EE6CDE0|nr:CHC2 zinc finger domain-containing protein [Treponema endosymbiont of Eucomonympha sp.]
MAGKISPETVKAVSEYTDIVALIGEYTRLEKRSGDWWGCCPFHHEKTPSFYVQPAKKMYYCFGCHEGGGRCHFL